MANRKHVRVVLDKQALADLLDEDQARQATKAAGDEFARVAREHAAKHTGAGAASIKARLVDNFLGEAKFAALVSWDRPHYYMYMQEHGTVKMVAHPALAPALAEFPDSYAQY